jgi:enoyl-CoA hydratase/carnithine racemase
VSAAPPVYETLLVEPPRDHVQVVTLNRPQVLNAINTQMGRELRAFFRDFDHGQEPDVRAVILAGAGERAFCAGADLKERRGMDEVVWRRQHVIFEEAFEALWRFPVPLIAAVNGVAFGGGCEIALACDLIVAAEEASFAQPEVKRGILPGGGGTQRLPRRIGIARAKELIFTGEPIDARTALHWGLANRVVPRARLLAEARALAAAIATNGPIAVRQAKKAIDRGYDLALESGLTLEIEAYNVALASEDRHEGINAFNEKRPPQFKNR